MLGHYWLEERIGTGGFGTVFKARDLLIRRPVAIKTCELEADGARARFAREAELAGSLSHPNIVAILDAEIERDVPFIVEEYLDGEDLDETIRRGGPRSLQEKLRILDGVAAGLAHAHANGVVHRDIKPANIRVLTEGTPKILDFGIAKSQDAAAITRPGMMVVSAGYMAPEQIEGRAVDHRADLFALGSLAYELVSGQPAFQAPSLSGLLDAILREEPAPLSEVADVPLMLEALVRRALAKDPEVRLSSADAFRVELGRLREDAAGEPVSAWN